VTFVHKYFINLAIYIYIYIYIYIFILLLFVGKKLQTEER